jgi:gliding motility-associated-like protein
LITCKNQPILFNGISRNNTGIYKDTLINSKGCDSFLYLHLTVNDTTKKDSFLTICKNQFVVFNGQALNTSGIYKDTLVNAKGCDSFLYLHLTVNDTTTNQIFQTICVNNPILFNGISRNTSGIYRDTLVNSKGCDSFVYLNLTVNDTTKKDSFLITCKNQPILFNGINRNISGIYRDTLVNSKGCDSFLYLHLTVNDTTKKDSFLTICENQPILFNGISRNNTGIYKDTLINSKGCDSFIYLHLTVNDTTKKDSFLIICKNQFVVFNGQALNTSGIYKDTLVNSKGCDSFMYLHLTVNDTTTNQIFQTICVNNPILFNGILRNISGLYKDTFVNSKGCDSFVYLNLTVNDTTKKDSFLITCKNQPIIFNGISRSITGIYRDTLINAKGCDSFLYLHLKVNDTTKKDSFLIICKNQPIIFNGISRNTSGIYRDTLVNSKGCDSFLYLHLTVNDTTKKDSFLIICKNQPIIFNGISRNNTGIYKDTLVNSKGCDSFLYLHLTVNDTTTNQIFQTICVNNPILFNGILRNTSGLYKDTFVNSKGCDSFVYLNLTVTDTTKKDSFLITCKNQPILFNGISRNNTGIYRDTLVNSKGCDSFMYLHLTVNPVTKSLILDTICEGRTFLNYSQTGTYFDTFVGLNQFGCDSIREIRLFVKPTVRSFITETICFGDTFLGYFKTGIYIDTLINASAIGCDSIRTTTLIVRPVELLIYETICNNQYFEKYNQSGIYLDTIIDNFGCKRNRTLNLTVLESSSSYISQEICYRDKIYGYNKTGIYIDTLINSNGCDSIRTLDILVRNKPLTPLKDTGICEGQRIVLNADKGFILYTWNDGTTKEELEVDQAGIYYLVVMDSFKCVDFDTILVSSYPTPTIKIITNDDLNNFEIGDRILFESNVEDNVSAKGVYNWYSNSTISCDTCENTFLNTQEENWLRIEYKSTNQCVAYDSIFFKKAGQLINIIEFPNSFSPNGDFLNDKFGPETKNVKNISWSVFNRWGTKVFESNSIYHFWDGIYKNEDQMSNLYYYTCEVEFNDGKKKSLKGELYLMR